MTPKAATWCSGRHGSAARRATAVVPAVSRRWPAGERSRAGTASPAEHLSDPDAWVEVGRWIGLATVNVTAVHDPDVVIFGGGVCASWARFAPSLHETVQRYLRLQPRT